MLDPDSIYPEIPGQNISSYTQITYTQRFLSRNIYKLVQIRPTQKSRGSVKTFSLPKLNLPELPLPGQDLNGDPD